jgi:hypothetical protein
MQKEGVMDQPVKKADLDFDYDRCRLEPRLDAERTPDAAGYWFLAAVLFAFIGAGIIVSAANYASPAAAQTSQLDPQPLLLVR